MNDRMRKTLPLVGVLALTTSAVVAGTGSALAGKADPVASLDKVFSGCDMSGAVTYYDARVGLDANKGRWVYLRGELEVGGETVDTLPWRKYDKNLDVEMAAWATGSPATAKAHVHLGDRKGVIVTEVFDICP